MARRLIIILVVVGGLSGAAIAIASDTGVPESPSEEQQAVIDQDEREVEQMYIDQLEDELETGSCAKILASGEQHEACEQIVQDASAYAAGEFQPDDKIHP